jgi:hypothetical protein
VIEALVIEVAFAAAVVGTLLKISRWPRPGDFRYVRMSAPKVVEGQVTLSSDHRGLV